MVIHNRITHLLLILVLLALVAVIGMLATGVRGGPLDPPGAPAPTGKTLEQIPGSWDRILPADDGGQVPSVGCDSTRFRCGQLGVLDRETGLVWSYEPNCCIAVTWALAKTTCRTFQNSARRGWRLPTAEELQSLVQMFVGSPTLPPGSPFQVFTNDFYWTATSTTETTAFAYNFAGIIGAEEPMTNTNYFWCVRGPGYDAQ